MKAFKAECCSGGDQGVAVAQRLLLAGLGSSTGAGSAGAAAPRRAAAPYSTLCLVFMKSVWIKCRLQACFELSFQFCGCDGWGDISAFIVCKFSFV